MIPAVCYAIDWGWIESPLSWISSINPTIGAALLTIVAGGIALYWNRWERKRQEFLELRRGIYLATADAYASEINFLSLISDPSTTQVQGRQIMETMSKVNAQINLVATKPVIEAMAHLQHALHSHHRTRIVLKIEADELAVRLAENGQIIQRAIQMLQPQPPPPNHREIFQRIQTLQEQNRGFGQSLTLLRWRMIDEWLDIQPTLACVISTAVIAVKQELGIDISAAWYTRMTAESLQTASNELREHFKPFRAADNPQIQETPEQPNAPPSPSA